jgi:hypothetical protein
MLFLIYFVASMFTAAGFFLPMATSWIGTYTKMSIMQPHLITMILVMLSFVSITVSAVSIVKGHISIRLVKPFFLFICFIGFPLFLYAERQACLTINVEIQEIEKMRESSIKTIDQQIDFFRKNHNTDALRDVTESKKRWFSKEIKYSTIGTGGILPMLGYLWFFVGFFVKTENSDYF